MALQLLDRRVDGLVTATLGRIIERTDIKSSLGPFRILPNYRTAYPDVVIQAIGNLYDEYNRAFLPLVAANREWPTDYQYCLPDGVPINWCVQIDTVGLSEAFLQKTLDMPEKVVRDILRHRIFEIENSIAMYQLLERFFSQSMQGDSFFKRRFRMMLNDLRRRFNRPIALLAVTEPKYHAMLASEFGKRHDEPLTDMEVMELSGFDTFFGPERFRRYLVENNNRCEYLLYVRSSDPLDKLKNPDFVVDHPLLGDIEMRRTIKAHTLTFNVDAPEMESTKRINDTKEYLVSMGMAFPIDDEEDLYSSEFREYLITQRIDPDAVATGKVKLRCKPAKGTYGCYGHVSGILTDRLFRKELRQNRRRRGPYIVQPEMEVPTITNATDGATFAYIDRNFFGMVGGRSEFLGGLRILMPMETTEAREGRIHGNASAVYAEIV